MLLCTRQALKDKPKLISLPFFCWSHFFKFRFYLSSCNNIVVLVERSMMKLAWKPGSSFISNCKVILRWNKRCDVHPINFTPFLCLSKSKSNYVTNWIFLCLVWRLARIFYLSSGLFSKDISTRQSYHISGNKDVKKRFWGFHFYWRSLRIFGAYGIFLNLFYKNMKIALNDANTIQ